MLFSPQLPVFLWDSSRPPRAKSQSSEHLCPLGAHLGPKLRTSGRLTQATLAIPYPGQRRPKIGHFSLLTKGVRDQPRPAFMPQDHIHLHTPPSPRPNHCLRPSDLPPIGLHLFFNNFFLRFIYFGLCWPLLRCMGFL